MLNIKFYQNIDITVSLIFIFQILFYRLKLIIDFAFFTLILNPRQIKKNLPAAK